MILVFFFSVLLADVIDLTDDIWDSTVKSSDPWFVGFFAPWCGHCKRFKPTFEEASNDPRSKPVQFGAVDSTANSNLAKIYDVHSYPTILFIHNGHKYRFRRERNVDGIVKYLDELTTSPTIELSVVVEVLLFEVIYVLVKGTDESKSVFEDVARKFLDRSHVKFYVTDNNDLCPSAQGAPTSNYVLRLEKNSAESFTTSLDQISLDDFVEKSSVPLVRQVKGYMQFRPIAKSAPYFFMLILNDESEIDSTKSLYFDALHATALQYSRDVFTFGLLQYSGLKILLEEQLKLKNDDMPKFVVYHEVSASFVVRDLSQNETDFGSVAVVEDILSGDPDWIYALPITDRARRFVSMQMEKYGIMGQIGFVVVIFMMFFGMCFCLDAYCFPEPTEEEIRRLREVREQLKKEKKKDD